MDRRRFLSVLSTAPIAARMVLSNPRMVEGPSGFVVPSRTIEQPLPLVRPLVVATELPPVAVDSLEAWVTDMSIDMRSDMHAMSWLDGGGPTYLAGPTDITMTLKITGGTLDLAAFHRLHDAGVLRVYFESGSLAAPTAVRPRLSSPVEPANVVEDDEDDESDD